MNPEQVVVDPPRAGLGAKNAQLLAALRVKRICYVSCDPATLARDLRLLLETGYHVEEIHMVDMFPQTFHVESVVRLAR
jgi:23S rRNA (uracil1939-C5)-methyltransferase